MRYLFLIITLLFIGKNDLNSQNSTDNLRKYKKQATINVGKIKNDFFAKINHLQAPPVGGESYRSYLRDLKKSFKKIENPNFSSLKTPTEELPISGRGFTANTLSSGVPNDNDMAISNNGMLVSVVNSSIFITDVNDPNYEPVQVSLSAFAEDLEPQENKYDPKIKYDPINDRFIMVFLNGTNSQTSEIIIAFSESNDPTDDWNLFLIEGNPFGNTTWSDYPMLAMTENEIFLTVNLLTDGMSWQEGFNRTVIWQIFKPSGFFQDELITRFWDNTFFDGKPIRNLRPVKSGTEEMNKNMYFLSNRNFDEMNDSIFILEITNEFFQTDTELKIDVRKTDVLYGVPPEAQQAEENIFDTNDGRILGAYLQDDVIHFVGNTRNFDTGLAAIYHGTVYDVAGDKSVTGYVIGDGVMDFGYPNISYTGREYGDDQCIITFNHTSPVDFDGTSAIFYNQGEYSDVLRLKEGETFVDVLNGSYDRWGDYSGSQRKFNEPGKVWMTGSYGFSPNTPGPLNPHDSRTWVSEVISPDSTYTPPITNTYNFENEPKTTIFPNPSTNFFTLNFDLPQKTHLKVAVYNAQGQLVKVLLNDVFKQGLNQLVFSTEPLVSGVYFVKIEGKEIDFEVTKKLVVE